MKTISALLNVKFAAAASTSKARRMTLPMLALLALTGCAGIPSPPDSSTSHPANPSAAQSPVPPSVPMLMSFTNMVMVKPVSEPAPEHHHGHGQPETQPSTEEKK